ncbi:MAG: TRAP transporter large permease subunit, partial [Chloroflexota bacterium]
CWIKPELGPIIPKEERLSLKEKILALKGIFIPIFIILAMLIGMYSGHVTPTEASGVGAALVFLFALIRKELTSRKLKDACVNSVKVSTMVIWIMMNVNVFSQVYFLLGGGDIITLLASELPGKGIMVILIMQVVIFILGTAMDDMVVILLLAPIFVPVIVSLGFSPVWFAVLFLIQVNISWISPPFGYTLIVLKAISPQNITMLDIWRAVMPFIAIQLVFLIIVLFLPNLVMWLPNLIIGK